MTKAEALFNQLTEEIPGATPGKMFGALCMKTPNGKSGAMFWHNHLVVKLTGHNLDEALSLDGTKPFEPMEGKIMNGWVQIPFDYHDSWKKFAEISVAGVSLLEAKAPKKK
jgi:hypothetical protein